MLDALVVPWIADVAPVDFGVAQISTLQTTSPGHGKAVSVVLA